MHLVIVFAYDNQERPIELQYFRGMLIENS